MGKRKDHPSDADSSTDSPLKKSKKLKKQPERLPDPLLDDEEDEDIDIMDSPPPKPAIKLKLKIGGQTLSTKSVESTSSAGPNESGAEEIVWKDVKSDVFKTKKVGDDTSDEEQQWLDALEKGELDDMGGIKRSKDPLLMTARQRAKLHGKPEEDLLQLPSGYRQAEDSTLSEEQITKRQQKAKKRKEQAHQKAEKDKKQTLDRLLKKQQNKRGGAGRGKGKGAQAPGFRYSNTASGISISVPEGLDFPCAVETVADPPKPKVCEVEGCSNPKKYSCSKTGKSLCSLQCYKLNLECNRQL